MTGYCGWKTQFKLGNWGILVVQQSLWIPSSTNQRGNVVQCMVSRKHAKQKWPTVHPIQEVKLVTARKVWATEDKQWAERHLCVDRKRPKRMSQNYVIGRRIARVYWAIHKCRFNTSHANCRFTNDRPWEMHTRNVKYFKKLQTIYLRMDIYVYKS